MSKQIVEGDTVVLNSGGPEMWVVSVGSFTSGEGVVWCRWFGNETLNTGKFASPMLKKIEKKPMSREEFLEKLRILAKFSHDGDTELGHIEADRLLIEYLDDQEVTEVWEGVCKWYA